MNRTCRIVQNLINCSCKSSLKDEIYSFLTPVDRSHLRIDRDDIMFDRRCDSYWKIDWLIRSNFQVVSKVTHLSVPF